MVPGISVKLTPEQGPAVIPIGGRNTFRAVVTNTGQLPLDNVQLELLFERPLEPLNATAGVDQAQMNQGRLVWTLPVDWILVKANVRRRTWKQPGSRSFDFDCQRSSQPNLSATDRLQITLGDGVGGCPESSWQRLGHARWWRRRSWRGIGGGGAQPGDSILPGGAPPVGACRRMVRAVDRGS